MTGDIKYCICGNCWFSNEKYTYSKKCFLGVEGEHRIYVYDEEPTDRTLTFKTYSEAHTYLEGHKTLSKVCNVKGNHYIDNIKEQIEGGE